MRCLVGVVYGQVLKQASEEGVDFPEHLAGRV
jgi:hypothetical protein